MNRPLPKSGLVRRVIAPPAGRSLLVRRLVTALAATATALALLVVVSPTAFAQPANDDFAGATVITSVPFQATEDTAQATSNPTDPVECSNNGSVWFAYTPPSTMTIEAKTFGSNYDTVLSAWTGTQGGLSLLACNDDFNGLQSRITVQAAAGTTIYFMVAFCCGGGGDGGGLLTFAVDQILPPANDDFADAAPVTALPFSDTVNLSAATTQPSEPSPSCVVLQNSAWYSFVPATAQAVTLRTDEYGAGIGVYTGTSLTNLSETTCSNVGQAAVLAPQAGTTYYIQVGAACCHGFGPVTVHLEVAQNPVANFDLVPSDPSIFDVVQFYSSSYDPSGGTVSSEEWAFGDGAVATGCCPTHRYAQDGDYTVVLTVATADGRAASTSRVVQVRTHDVAIVKIALPSTAHLGQTLAVTVYVRNNRLPETVQVDLFKSVPGGFTQVGSLTQSVPVRPPGGNSTKFAFTYTVSQADKTVGKVSFRATATLLDHRDALPADNELTSPPVKIT